VSCCTDAGGCGSGSPEIFGNACFERDQPGTPNTECPDGSVFLYVDLGSYSSVGDYFEGCCRPDGLCGFDTSRTLGAGCVERSELSRAVENGCSGYEPLPPYESIPCSP
jgi:hypothetical protein